MEWTHKSCDKYRLDLSIPHHLGPPCSPHWCWSCSSLIMFFMSTADGWRQGSQRWHHRRRHGSVHWRHRHGGHEPPGGPEQDQELHRQPQPHSAEVSYNTEPSSVGTGFIREQEDICLHDGGGLRHSVPHTLTQPFRFKAVLRLNHTDSTSMQMLTAVVAVGAWSSSHTQ